MARRQDEIFFLFLWPHALRWISHGDAPEYLTTRQSVGICSNMKATLLLRERLVISQTAFVELVVWQVSEPVKGSGHRLKYRLALIADRACVLRYDNEAGKGDHRHIGEQEVPYRFVDVETLQRDFWADVEAWRNR